LQSIIISAGEAKISQLLSLQLRTEPLLDMLPYQNE
jgi:hypothetical protein